MEIQQKVSYPKKILLKDKVHYIYIHTLETLDVLLLSINYPHKYSSTKQTTKWLLLSLTKRKLLEM